MNNETRKRTRHHPEPRCFTMSDAARWLNADVSVVKRAIAEGLLEPHYFFGEGYLRILESDLEEFVRAQPTEKVH